MRTDDIPGAYPNKFAHFHKKYIFENYIQNDTDNITNIFSNLFDRSIGNDPRSIEQRESPKVNNSYVQRPPLFDSPVKKSLHNSFQEKHSLPEAIPKLKNSPLLKLENPYNSDFQSREND